MKTTKEPLPATINRRAFLKTSGGFALLIGTGGILPQLLSCTDERELREAGKKHQLTSWVQLTEDGRIIIFNPAAEMGQGSMTSLPAIFAEEMDADWRLVEVVFSPQEAAIYGSDGWSPDRKVMLSAGSHITRDYFPIMRKAGAQARYLMLYSAAEYWDVPLAELHTEAGKVVHAASGDRLSYAELVPHLRMPAALPDISEEQLKSHGDFRLIGKVLPRTDIPGKTNGSALFAIDLKLPGMLYAVLERGAVHGARPSLNNKEEILAMDGILKVVSMDHAIGLLASRFEQALAAKNRLDISWGPAEASGFNSQEVYSEYERIADRTETGTVLVETGDVEKAFQAATKSYTADFKNDYVYHAQMEPLNAIVQVEEDLQHATVWVGSQQGFDEKLGVPELLGIPPENVDIRLQYLGGGFGRRSMTDFVTECAFLAREVPGNPVKLLWTREDDLRYGAFRPLSLQRLKACTDAGGNLTGFSHCVVGDGGHLVASGIRNEYYDIPNQLAEWRETSHGIRLKHWRAVGHGPNKFAIECMIDEVAHGQGTDPVAFRRILMGKSPRALATLEKAAEMANWQRPAAEGRARGVAFLERSGSLSTGICEISLNRETGVIRVHHFWNALDCGIVVQPDNVKAQMEGGILMGISSVLKEQITIRDGRVQQSNFNDYPILRMDEIPDSVDTSLIDSGAPPQGVGESGTPLVACAVSNAFFSLTGKHLRHLPFSPERVLEALNS